MSHFSGLCLKDLPLKRQVENTHIQKKIRVSRRASYQLFYIFSRNSFARNSELKNDLEKQVVYSKSTQKSGMQRFTSGSADLIISLLFVHKHVKNPWYAG